MLDSIIRASALDEDSLAPLAKRVAEWEPTLELYSANQTEMIFEPDGTLYAVCLSASTLRFRHRFQQVQPGDCLVIPQSVAIDAEPGIDLLCLRHSGTPPHHFRERFIQVSGFEYLTSTPRPDVASETLIDPGDARHRIPITLLRTEAEPRELSSAGLEIPLVVVVAGSGTITSQANLEVVSLNQGDVLAVPSGVACNITGNVTCVCLRLWPEIAYESGRIQAENQGGDRWSPEFRSR